MNDLEAALVKLHSLAIKSDSRMVLRASPTIYPETDFQDRFGKVWRVVPTVQLLGPVLACNGDPTYDIQRTRSAILSVYWRSARILANKMVSFRQRVKKLDQTVCGILRARSASWNPSQSVVLALDRLQFKILGWMLRLPRDPHETPAQFSIRRARELKGKIITQWSRVYCFSCISWLSHLQRHSDSMAGHAFREQDFEWLSSVRRVWTCGSSKTGTRTARGRVYRWDASGWCTALSPEGSRDPRVLWDLSRQLLLALGGKDKTTE